MALRESKNYYTVAQVKKILGITNEMLYNYVENGALERIIPPGKKQGVYQRSQVDQLARELQTFMIHRQKRSTKLTTIGTREEMRECVRISQELFGIERDTTDERIKLVEKNQETYYTLKDEDQIVGYFAIIPYRSGMIDKVLRQTLPSIIEADDIEEYKEGIDVDLWLHVIAVSPRFNTYQKHTYGARLVAGIMELILNLGKRGINIGIIAARSNMPDGIRLMRKLGFTEIPRLTPERRTFIIDIEKSGIPLIEEYKKVLEESRIAPQE